MTSTPGVDGLIEAFSTSTGRRQRIPADWVGHPVLGKDFALTPQQRQIDGELGPVPTEADKVDEIRAYAAQAGIDTGDAKTKVELVAAIEAAFASGPFQVGVELTPRIDPDAEEPAEPFVLDQQPPADQPIGAAGGAQPGEGADSGGAQP